MYLYCLIGKSGCGKTTLVSELSYRYGLKIIDSYTTRPKRKDNEIGHIFVSKEEFAILKPNLVAYTLFNNFEYGVTQSQIDENDLYVVDYIGYKYLLDHYKGNKIIKSIFVDCKEEVLKIRMKKRGDNELSILERVYHDRTAFKNVKKACDYCVLNHILEPAVREIKRIMDYNNNTM